MICPSKVSAFAFAFAFVFASDWKIVHIVVNYLVLQSFHFNALVLRRQMAPLLSWGSKCLIGEFVIESAQSLMSR